MGVSASSPLHGCASQKARYAHARIAEGGCGSGEQGTGGAGAGDPRAWTAGAAGRPWDPGSPCQPVSWIPVWHQASPARSPARRTGPHPQALGLSTHRHSQGGKLPGLETPRCGTKAIGKGEPRSPPSGPELPGAALWLSKLHPARRTPTERSLTPGLDPA